MVPETEQLSVTLSREELTFLLYLLKSGPILGIDPDPLEKYSKEQSALTFAHAERSLRARDLAKVNQGGTIVVREEILLMVGTCAFPEFLIAAHSFPFAGVPKRFFWNGRSGVIVAHERSEAPLHHLSFLANRDALLKDIQLLSRVENPEKIHFDGFKATNNLLKTVREQVQKSKKKATTALEKAGASSDSAKEICSLLSGEHVVTALHSLISRPEGESIRESATLLTGKTSTWLLENMDDDNLFIKPVSGEYLNTLFTKWTSPADNWIEIPSIPS